MNNSRQKRSFTASHMQKNIYEDTTDSPDKLNSKNSPLIQVRDFAPSLETQPSIILYAKISKPDPDEFKFEYYPPPEHLRPPLINQINTILNKHKKKYKESMQSAEPIRINNKFQSVSDKRTFIHPKSIESVNKQKRSRILKQFLSAYKEIFVTDGKQTINENPYAVDQILYSGLSASAVASFKWNSVSSKRRIISAQPICPQFQEYPLTPRTLNNLEELKIKVQQAKAPDSNKNLSFLKKKNSLLLQRQKQLDVYLKDIEQLNKSNQLIYGVSFEEYKDVLDYCNATKGDYNSFDIQQAEQDIDFMKQSEKNFCQNPEEWLKKKSSSKMKSYIPNENSVKKIPTRYKSLNNQDDTDDIFDIKPNTVPQSMLRIFGSKNNSSRKNNIKSPRLQNAVSKMIQKSLISKKFMNILSKKQ